MENKRSVYHGFERFNSLLIKMIKSDTHDTVGSIHRLLRTSPVLTSGLLAIDSEYAKSLMLKNHWKKNRFTRLTASGGKFIETPIPAKIGGRTLLSSANSGN